MLDANVINNGMLIWELFCFVTPYRKVVQNPYIKNHTWKKEVGKRHTLKTSSLFLGRVWVLVEVTIFLKWISKYKVQFEMVAKLEIIVARNGAVMFDGWF